MCSVVENRHFESIARDQVVASVCYTILKEILPPQVTFVALPKKTLVTFNENVPQNVYYFVRMVLNSKR